MIDSQLSDNKVLVDIDGLIYSDAVISKVCYWLTRNYIVNRKKLTDNHHRIVVETKMPGTNLEDLRFQISQLLSDYKMREIILLETKDIQNILYVKAFANNDEFEDYNLDF